jgi:type IV pilus assembly protein PilA
LSGLATSILLGDRGAMARPARAGTSSRGKRMARDPELDEFIDEPKPKVAPGAKRGPSVTPTSGAPRAGVPTWVIILVVVLLVGPFLLGIVASVAIYGMRRYSIQAKIGEGRTAVAAIAQGMTSCFAENGSLPETSRSVPSELAMVSGKKYQSASEDWNDEAFRCAGFTFSGPQYFQYQWVLGDEKNAGKVRAIADLDGTGDPEVRLELDVDCSGEACRVADTLREDSPVAPSR